MYSSIDEATSSLDSKTEQAILTALREITGEHTSLVIAHRLSTVVDTDKIVMFHHGTVVEQGDHAKLLVEDGQYAEFWGVLQKQRVREAAGDDLPMPEVLGINL